MNKDVLIHVRGLQLMETDDEQEPIEIVVPGQYYFRNGSMIKSEFLTQGNITWYLDENGKFQLNKSGLIAYSHGEYLDLGKEIGTFGYSVKKKTKKPQKRRKKKVER